MTDKHGMPQYDGMEYEELVVAAQFLWMENAKLRELVEDVDEVADPFLYEFIGRRKHALGIEVKS